MSAAPARNELSDVYPNPSNGVARTGMGRLWDWLTGMFGTDGFAYGFERRNMLINPNWLIDQINEGALYTVTGGGADVLTVDGWSGSGVAAPGIFKVRRLVDPDNAALKCLEITCTTIDAAIAATDAYYLHTAIEGQEAAELLVGTASAQQISINFKFKSNVAGVYGISIANSALNRSYVGFITVADALEHDYTVTLTLDTTGTWLYDTGVGIRLRICLACGSNFQKASGAWGADNMLSTSAQANFMSNIANVAYLKRIQLLQGSIALPLAPPDIQRELAKCQRYFEKTFAQGVAVAQNAGRASSIEFTLVAAGAVTTGISMAFGYKVTKRIIPTLTFFNPSAANAFVRNQSRATDATTTTGGVSTNADSLYFTYTGLAAWTAGDGLGVAWTANARLT